MATVVSSQRMTLDEFNSLPDDDGVDRMLIRGVLVEEPMTKRNRWHALVEATVARLLGNWALDQDSSPGAVFSGEVGCELIAGGEASSVGIDVALFSTELLDEQSEDARFIQGPPILAVEILSPSDTQERIQQKTDVYLNAGTQLVWIIDPHFKTVTAFSSGVSPMMFSGEDVLSANQLPGFSAPVSSLFTQAKANH
ncbi:MAG: Uma2 family endonuclease [Planctomycetota bacterium]|nr:Uma2 family endonuclease [Planctomycetota bacterium]MDA0917630.1 Uma2 family endonuclease [Planctomycetota bacterium]MDA1158463.1 Uma2 family endonuclease [Planctomycetota bacterium]